MEKILLVTSDQEKHQSLLLCLKLLFPECLIKAIPGKTINDSEELAKDLSSLTLIQY
jgi:hypothetical protein